jgi:hypothetical protein
MKIGVGPQLSDETFEPVILSAKKNTLFDLRATQFIDPYGMVGLIEVGIGTFYFTLKFSCIFCLTNIYKYDFN